MLSRKTKYAIKALTVLAKNPENKPIHISEIATKESLPKKYLEAILIDLKRFGFIASRKGTTGGYYMLKRAEDIKLSALYRIFEGPIALTPCASVHYYEKCVECDDEVTCTLRGAMLNVRNATLGVLDNTSIADLAIDNNLAGS